MEQQFLRLRFRYTDEKSLPHFHCGSFVHRGVAWVETRAVLLNWNVMKWILMSSCTALVRQNVFFCQRTRKLILPPKMITRRGDL